VAGGYLKLILETNFDRLVETAIQETAGIVPTLITSVDVLPSSRIVYRVRRIASPTASTTSTGSRFTPTRTLSRGLDFGEVADQEE
jgi:hypothetical protein